MELIIFGINYITIIALYDNQSDDESTILELKDSIQNLEKDLTMEYYYYSSIRHVTIQWDSIGNLSSIYGNCNSNLELLLEWKLNKMRLIIWRWIKVEKLKKDEEDLKQKLSIMESKLDLNPKSKIFLNNLEEDS